jgi:hypothetical protein
MARFLLDAGAGFGERQARGHADQTQREKRWQPDDEIHGLDPSSSTNAAYPLRRKDRIEVGRRGINSL